MDAFANISIDELRELYEQKMKQEILTEYHFPTKPTSDGYYHVYVADPTKKTGRRAVKAKTLDELKEKVYQHEKGLNGTARKTFREVFEITQGEKLRYVKDPEKRLSVQNTIGRNETEYRRYFAGTPFEKMYVDEITKKEIENICMMNLSRYSLTKKAFLSMRGILKAVFRLAFGEYWINDNTYERVDYRKYNDMLVKTAENSERAHSAEEIDRMLSYIHEHQRKYPTYLPSYALELQIAMGLRRGEIPPLMWSDVKENCIVISKEQLTVKKSADNPKEYFQIVNHTKTYKVRYFPLIASVSDILTRLQEAHRRARIESPFLFPAKSQNGVITNNTVYNFYRRMCRALDIPIQKELKKGTHSFRRNAITNVVNNSGGNVILASQLFGNSPDVALTHYYTRATDEQARAALEMS